MDRRIGKAVHPRCVIQKAHVFYDLYSRVFPPVSKTDYSPPCIRLFSFIGNRFLSGIFGIIG